MAPLSLHQQALAQLDKAATHLGLPAEAVAHLRLPEETTQVRLTLAMDDGTRQTFAAWRCRYDSTRGPTKGGLRFHPSSSVEEVEALAFWMTFKCALLGLPYGGGKGAVRVDPAALSQKELEQLSRAYVARLFHVIGPDRDIIAPDVNTDATIMGWMTDEYSRRAGKPSPAVATGKPLAMGGSAGREDATGRGGFYLLRSLEAALGIGPGARVAVQGFGNVGLHMALLLHGAGYLVVAVSDSRGATGNPQGLDIPALAAHKTATGNVAAFTGGSAFPAEDLVACDCDVLAPAAFESTIHAGNVERMRARIIVELANGPVTPEADALLDQRGVVVLPDILANAGGVTVSWFEWEQNRANESWPLETIHTRLHKRMNECGANVMELASSMKISPRAAAYVMALKNILAI